jgi:hypothetical protein
MECSTYLACLTIRAETLAAIIAWDTFTISISQVPGSSVVHTHFQGLVVFLGIHMQKTRTTSAIMLPRERSRESGGGDLCVPRDKFMGKATHDGFH